MHFSHDCLIPNILAKHACCLRQSQLSSCTRQPHQHLLLPCWPPLPVHLHPPPSPQSTSCCAALWMAFFLLRTELLAAACLRFLRSAALPEEPSVVGVSARPKLCATCPVCSRRMAKMDLTALGTEA